MRDRPDDYYVDLSELLLRGQYMTDSDSVVMEHLNKGVLPSQDLYKISIEDLQSQEHHAGVPVATSDFQIVIYEDDPGASRVWHAHMPDMYQIIYGLKGEIEWTYKDGDEEIRTTTVGPGEALYVPGGFDHKTKVVGDEPNRHLIIMPRTHVGRINDMFGTHIEKHLYSSVRDRAGLWYDTVNDRLVNIDEDAVEVNPDDS